MFRSIDEGALYTWGCGETGLLGVTDTKDSPVPRRIDTLRGVQLQQVCLGLGGVAGAVSRTFYSLVIRGV